MTTSAHPRPLITPISELDGGYGSVNPFVAVTGPGGARGFLAFVTAVLDGTETPEAHTVDTDGLLIHAEIRVGDSCILVCDAKPAWPFTPALLQVNAHDPEEVLRRAREHGARVITEVTPFYGGSTIARFLDPWHDVWWVFGPADPSAEPMSWDPEQTDPGTEGGDGPGPSTTGESRLHAEICRAMEGLVAP